MRLIIFDIDGTLTATVKTDEECYVRSLAEIYGFTDVETDWSHYRHATDPGIFHEIYEARVGRAPLDEEVMKFRRHFVELLARASSGSAFSPIAGAPQLVSRLTRTPGHHVAIATGAWSESARLKMASAGMCYDDHPAASGDDALDRQSIIKLAMQRAIERYGPFESAVYVGDGVWDASASRGIGIPFIGIADGARATRLIAEGAICVFPDLSDGDSFLRSLSEAAEAA